MGERWYRLCMGCMYDKMGTIGEDFYECEKTI